MEPWAVMLILLGVTLALWYVPLAIYEHRRRRRPLHRYRSSGGGTIDDAPHAAITTTVICSSIDVGHHG